MIDEKDPSIITDKQIRDEYRRQGAAYNMLQGVLAPNVPYESHAVSDNNGLYGNFSIIKTNNNGAGRYKDEWDFIGDGAIAQPLGIAKRVVIGDTIYANPRARYHNFGKATSTPK